MVDFIWLLLPVAVFFGWIMGYRAKSQNNKNSIFNYKDLSGQNIFNQKYIKGLNFILNEQTDKAVDVFIDLFSVDSDTVETHLALGSLFRRRGEVERAIRIHQNVIARPNLSREQRLAGLLELGLDYLNAGVLDRAENIFKDYVKQEPDNIDARQYLLDIYQQQKDWHASISTALLLSKLSTNKYSNNIAHYYCELSSDAIDKGDMNEALFFIKQALKYQNNNIRANLILIDLFLFDMQIRKTMKIFFNIAHNNKKYLDILLPKLIDIHYNDNYNLDLYNLNNFIDKTIKSYPSILILPEVITLLINQKGYDYTYDLLIKTATNTPKLRVIANILNLISQNNNPDESYKLLNNCINKLVEDQKSYCCNNCGFTCNELLWLCPSCRTWDNINHIDFI